VGAVIDDWPTVSEVYAAAGRTPPAWSDLPGLCGRVCPEHKRHCAQQHTDGIGHACVFCTTTSEVPR